MSDNKYRKLKKALKIYDEYLNGKKFILENSEGIQFEFCCKSYNFMHLTGVEVTYKITPKEFYKRLKKNRIRNNDLIFTDKSIQKLSVFENLILNKNCKIKISEDIYNHSVYFHFDYSICKDDAILCVKNNSPISLLQKNKNTNHTKFNDCVIVEVIDM